MTRSLYTNRKGLEMFGNGLGRVRSDLVLPE